MERLLVLELDARGCEAEAVVNGIPVARAGSAQPRAVLPVHEYTLSGSNRLELIVWPGPAAAPADAATPAPLRLTADGDMSARLTVLLPRAGHPAETGSSRELGAVTWSPEAGQPYEAPLRLSTDVDLPVNFARWRWLDAPPAAATPTLLQAALALARNLAQELSAGNIENYIAQVRLRTEELAAAYAQPADEATRQLREHLAGLHASGRFAWQPLEPDAFFLRQLAGGRLFECLDATGAPALRTVPDAAGSSHQFPLRLAAVEGKLYVLR